MHASGHYPVVRAGDQGFTLRDTARWGALGVGVLSVSVAAILIRLADAEPLTVAAFRMGIAAIVVGMAALILRRRQHWSVPRSELPWLVVSGTALAIHFAAFVGSLSLTSVSSAVLIATSAPIFIGFASRWLAGDRVPPATVVAIGLSLAGGVVLALGDLNSGTTRLSGDLLALVAALAAAVYYLIGRRVRQRAALLPYVAVVYGISAFLLLAAALATGSPFSGLPGHSYFWMTMIALISQVLGHSTLNWALAYMTAAAVALAVRAEPVLATLIAIPVLGEVPGWTALPGGALILSGAYVAIRAEGSQSASTAAQGPNGHEPLEGTCDRPLR